MSFFPRPRRARPPPFSFACALLPSHHALAQTPPIDTTPVLPDRERGGRSLHAQRQLQLDTPVETGSRLGLTARETAGLRHRGGPPPPLTPGCAGRAGILRAIPRRDGAQRPGSMAASYRASP